jgi:hypothetical protein
MNTWGKRPYSSLPETGSFEELTVKKLKFGDCPVSLPTDCPPINGSALAFDTNGVGRWSSGPPAAVQDRIQDAANTCSVVCSAAGDVTMTGAGGEYVTCFGDEISLVNGQTSIVLYQYGVVMATPNGELFYSDVSTTRLDGPGGAAQVALKGDEVEIIAPGLQLLLPGSAADKVLTCLDDTGVAEWREPAIPVQIQDALNSNSAVECDVDNIYIEPGTDLMINLPSGNGADKVLTCVDDDGFVEWRDPAIPNRIQDPGNVSSRVWCDSDNIYIQPEIGLLLDLDSNVPGKVLTCIDVDGTAGWQDPAPAAIASRIQDLGGAVVECVTGDVAISTPASGKVTIGASAVATSKIQLESVELQVSIPSVGANKVLTSIDTIGTAEWRDPAPVIASRIQDTPGIAVVECPTGTIAGTINSIERVFVNSTTTRLQSSSGASNRLELVGNTVTLACNNVGVFQTDSLNTYMRAPGGNTLLINASGVGINGLYTLPTTQGASGAVLTRSGSNISIWQVPQVQAQFSGAAAPTVVANTTVLTPLNPGGTGSLSVAGFTTYTSYVIKAGGTFRNNANNTAITFRLGTLPVFNSGVISLPNITAPVAWNAEFWFTYTGGSNSVTQMNLSYNGGTTTRVYQTLASVILPQFSTDLGVYVQWGVASANNTLTCNVLSILKTF